MIKVKDDGIYDYEQCIDCFGATVGCRNKLIITKEAFVEAYKKWIEEPLVKECVEYKKQLESEKY